MWWGSTQHGVSPPHQIAPSLPSVHPTSRLTAFAIEISCTWAVRPSHCRACPDQRQGLCVVQGQRYYIHQCLAGGCQESPFTLGPSTWDPQGETAQVLYEGVMPATLHKRPRENESLHCIQRNQWQKVLTIKIKHLEVWSSDSLA